MEDTAMFANTQVATARVIHTPSAFARESLLHLQEAGMLRALAPHVSRRENLPSYLCFLVTAGAGSLSYGGRTYDLEAGDCVFLDCRRGYAQSTSAHRDGSGSYDALWSLRWAHFDGPTMAGIYEKYQERGGQPVFSCTPHRQTRYEELLRFTDKTVEEIGQDCGFPDANYFARSFKKSRAFPQRTTADSGKCRTRKLSAIQKHPGAGAHRLCIRLRDVFDKRIAVCCANALFACGEQLALRRAKSRLRRLRSAQRCGARLAA